MGCDDTDSSPTSPHCSHRYVCNNTTAVLTPWQTSETYHFGRLSILCGKSFTTRVSTIGGLTCDDADDFKTPAKTKPFNVLLHGYMNYNLLVILSDGRCTSAGDEIDFFIFDEDLDGVEAAGMEGFFFFRLDNFAPASFLPFTIIPSTLLLLAIAVERRLRGAAAPGLLPLASILIPRHYDNANDSLIERSKLRIT